MFKKKQQSTQQDNVVNSQIAGFSSVVGSIGKKSKLTKPGSKILVVLLVLLVLGGGYFAYQNFFQKEAPVDEKRDKAFDTLYKKDKDAAQKQLANADSESEKSDAYVNLSNVEGGENNKTAALEHAKKAVEQEESIDSLIALGFRAEQAGDYELAAESYGKAASIAKQQGLEYDYKTYIGMKESVENR